MKTVFVLFLLALSGCSSLPSFKYCEKVNYNRDGMRVIIHAECTVPAGAGL